MERKYPESAVRRAMTVQEVILKAVGGELKWIEAADILGVTPRTIRRMHASYKAHGLPGLIDRRRGSPSPRRAAFADVEQVLRLYREKYRDFNVKHFHEKLVEKHGLSYGYTWVKLVLQKAGMVKRSKGRGGHRQRRERRALFGQMLHLDGSEHEWLSLRPGERQELLLVVDDATGRNLAGRLVEAETTKSCLGIMRDVVEAYGIPAQLYTDRNSVYWVTEKGRGRVDKENLTQFGRAMEQLGVEMIAACSPQARGRSERWNATWQNRLVNELRAEGIETVEAANRYIGDVFLPEMNRRFAVEAKASGSAFVRARGADLERIFSVHHESRTVANDNTVRVKGRVLQIEPSRFRETFARCTVDVLEHLDGTYSIIWKGRAIGRYDADGQTLGGAAPKPPKFSAVTTREEGKRKGGKPESPPLPRSPAGARVDLHRSPILPQAPEA
ncbi:MAG: ISNCY family transposase [Myxococcales bacterium]|nr:MAG: ISNCY family transposase [Myxococcales bacterium]